MARKRKHERVQDIWEWLTREFPVRRKATLHFEPLDKDHQGYVVYDDKTVDVHVDRRMPMYAVIETLLHEWAHVKSRRQGHGIEFLWWEYQINERFWIWRKEQTTRRLARGRSSKS